MLRPGHGFGFHFFCQSKCIILAQARWGWSEGYTVPIYVYDGDSLTHALFRSNTNSICENGPVTFIDLSSGHPDSIQWFFPGGIPASSKDSIPTILYNSPGTYDVSLIATYPYKIDTLSLHGYIKIESTPTIYLSFINDTIFSSFANAFAYQWYHNGNLIDSSYQYFLVPDSSGYYFADLMTIAGCIARSDTLYYSPTSINIIQDSSYIPIYPNPTNDLLFIRGMGLDDGNYNITLTNMLGQILNTIQVGVENNILETQLSMKEFSSDLYIITINSNKIRQTFKFLKQ